MTTPTERSTASTDSTARFGTVFKLPWESSRPASPVSNTLPGNVSSADDVGRTVRSYGVSRFSRSYGNQGTQYDASH